MSVLPHEGRQGTVPSGTVTFAFTDIEGSTQRWERHANEMEWAVRRHDELLRSAFTRHRGHVFKTVGDAFCVAFWSPADALAAILAAQGALAEEDFKSVDGLRVRAAVHTGTAYERDGDYFGPTVNRVARLLAIGHGGQVLVSGVTTELVQDALPPTATLRDLGEHRLRDLARPEQVYQLLAPGLADEFPPLRSIALLSNNLPHQLTSFVGRETEIAEIVDLIAQHRLVTLTGSGGVGKTRASLQVAASLLDGWTDGVWFIELAPLSSGEYIPSTVAQAFGIKLAPESGPVENLVGSLRTKRTLIVFDNCEHLLEPAARVISAILQRCPQVRILASSRQALGIAGEATFRMPSLSVPRDAESLSLTAADSAHYAAISLFVERARAVDNRFGLSDENAPIIADICRRLDGIPLAIELAASRVPMLSPRQLRERLDDRFRVLTGGSRDALSRHQTLRALIDWSHDLLDEQERMIFRRLGFFVNGFTLEGAVAVGGGDDLDELDVFNVLASLVSKSLVLAEPNGDSRRYGLLESTRVYASEKLDAAGERELVAARHLRYLRDQFASLRALIERTGQKTEFNEALATELEDIRFALDGALARSDVVEGAELLSDLGSVYLAMDSGSMRRCEQYLAALPASESRLLALVSNCLAHLLRDVGQRTRSFEIGTKAVAHARESGDATTLAYTLRTLGATALSLRLLEEAEAALVEAEANAGASPSLRNILRWERADLSGLRGDFETCERMFEQFRGEARSLGNVRQEQLAAINQAEYAHVLGRTQHAIEIVQETLPSLRSGEDRDTLATMLANLAGYFVCRDNLADAVATAREAIRIRAAQAPEHNEIGNSIEHLALVHALRGDLARAARQEGYTDELFRRHGSERDFTEKTSYNRLMELLREGLGADELERLLAEGAALTPEAAIALALEDS